MIKAPIKKKKQTELVEYKVKGDSVFVAGKLIGHVSYQEDTGCWASNRHFVKPPAQLFVGISNAKHSAIERVVKAHMYDWKKHGGGR